MQKYYVCKPALIRQGREDLRQDPAVSDNPVNDHTQSQDLGFALRLTKRLPANYCEIKNWTPADCVLKLALSGE